MLKPLPFFKKLFTTCVALKDYNALVDKCSNVANDLDLCKRRREQEVTDLKNQVEEKSNTVKILEEQLVKLQSKSKVVNTHFTKDEVTTIFNLDKDNVSIPDIAKQLSTKEDSVEKVLTGDTYRHYHIFEKYKK